MVNAGVAMETSSPARRAPGGRAGHNGLTMHVLVAGCGWLGEALARVLVGRGHRVTGIRRDPARAGALASLGVEPLALDLAAPGAEAHLPAADAVVACQSAGAEGEGAYRAAYVDALRPLLAAASRSGARLVYTGSTGVFGQRDGSDVDEETPPAPASAAAAVLVEAETLVRDAAARGTHAAVLRLSGLYGPGRAGILERVRQGVLGPPLEAAPPPQPLRRVRMPRHEVEVEVSQHVPDRERVDVLRPERGPLGRHHARGQRAERRELGGREVVPRPRVALARQDEPAADRRGIGEHVEREAPVAEQDPARHGARPAHELAGGTGFDVAQGGLRAALRREDSDSIRHRRWVNAHPRRAPARPEGTQPCVLAGVLRAVP